jgi:hypothetical protein
MHGAVNITRSLDPDNVCLGSIAPKIRCPHHVRFPSNRDQIADITPRRRQAKRRHQSFFRAPWHVGLSESHVYH